MNRTQVTLAVLALAAVLAVGCGSDETQRDKGRAQSAQKDPRELDIELLPAQEPSLGRGPWDVEDVTAFVRPAYAALGGEGRSVVALNCTPGSLLAPGADEGGRLFTCIALYSDGAQVGRETAFADDGTVAAERDATPKTERVNPGVQCTSRPEIEPSLPDCDDVQVGRPTTRAGEPDPALYGSADDRTIPEGQDGNPRECPPVNGELVQTVRLSCDDAAEVAEHVTADDGCAPQSGTEELQCQAGPLYCFGTANVDPANPWSFTCKTENQETAEGEYPYVDFYLPPP